MEDLARKIVFGLSLVTLWRLSSGFRTDKCVDLIWQMRNCTSKFHLPETCDKLVKSKVLVCAEETAKKLPTCKDEIAQRMIKHYVTAYRTSDIVVCQSTIHAELDSNHKCVAVTKMAMATFGVMAPGFLSKKGCGYVKTALLVVGLAHTKIGCFEIAEDYINAMYAESSCKHVEVENPVYTDVEDTRNVLGKLVMCWVSHTDFPKCDDKISKRLKCVNNVTLEELRNPHLRTLAENMIHVTKTTDSIICSDKKLKKDFLASPDCWRAVRIMGILMLEQINGYYSKDGCASLEYREKYKMILFNPKCHDLLQDYRIAINKVLPCAPEEAVSRGGNIETSSIFIIVLLLSLSIEIFK